MAVDETPYVGLGPTTVRAVVPMGLLDVFQRVNRSACDHMRLVDVDLDAELAFVDLVDFRERALTLVHDEDITDADVARLAERWRE